LCALFAKDHISKIDEGFFNFNQSLLACADQRDIDATSFTQDGEYRIDVFIQLWSESNGYGSGQTCRHATSWGILDVEEVLDLIIQREQFERTEGK